jgi:CRP-like cAMP-binding protein
MAMSETPIDLVRGLPAADASAILALGRPLGLRAGEMLFPVGAPADSLYVIRRGLIALTFPLALEGRDEDVVIEEHVAGETLGWSALVPPHRFTLKGIAPEGAEVLEISRHALLGYCASHPDAGFIVGMNIAATIGHRLQLFQAMWLRQVQHAVSRAHA